MNSLLPLVITMNSLLPLVIIIYMFNYQCSRVTVAVTKVCNYCETYYYLHDESIFLKQILGVSAPKREVKL